MCWNEGHINLPTGKLCMVGKRADVGKFGHFLNFATYT